VTAIEEAKDLNTLSVEDLISYLKCHEIGLSCSCSTWSNKTTNSYSIQSMVVILMIDFKLLLSNGFPKCCDFYY